MKTEIGDKIRLKEGKAAGEKAVVERIKKKSLVVVTEENGVTLEVDIVDVTNLSLAARKAWLTMPKRRVGRPEGSKKTKRTSVTLRIDSDLWEEFKQLEAEGVIDDRTETVNKWFRQRIGALKRQEKNSNGKTNHS